MPVKATFGNAITLKIKNILKADEKHYSNVGKRTVMSLADAKAAKICDFEFMLSAHGNFMKVIKDETTGAIKDVVEYNATTPEFINATANDGTTVTYDGSVAVIARVATRANDRYIQFFATQQKILLAPGDELELTVKTGAEAAHYLELAVDGEIEVTTTAVAEIAE